MQHLPKEAKTETGATSSYEEVEPMTLREMQQNAIDALTRAKRSNELAAEADPYHKKYYQTQNKILDQRIQRFREAMRKANR